MVPKHLRCFMYKYLYSAWLIFPVVGLLLLVGLATGVVNERTGVGPEWEWADNPLNTLDHDQVLVCLQAENLPSGPWQIQTRTASGQERPMVFWDNQLGHCAKLSQDQVGTTWLLPQRQRWILTAISVTSWQNSWKTHQLLGQQGGWLID